MSTDDAFIAVCSRSFISGFMLNKGFPGRHNALPVVRIFLTAAKGYPLPPRLKRLLTINPYRRSQRRSAQAPFEADWRCYGVLPLCVCVF